MRKLEERLCDAALAMGASPSNVIFLAKGTGLLSPSLAQGAVPSLLYSINIFFALLKVPVAPVTINSVNGTDVSELEPVSGYTQVARNEPLGVQY